MHPMHAEECVSVPVRVLEDDKLSLSARCVYFFIMQSSMWTPDGIDEVDLKTMVKCSTPSIRTWTKQLEDAGYIKKDYLPQPPGIPGRRRRIWEIV